MRCICALYVRACRRLNQLTKKRSNLPFALKIVKPDRERGKQRWRLNVSWPIDFQEPGRLMGELLNHLSSYGYILLFMFFIISRVVR